VICYHCHNLIELPRSAGWQGDDFITHPVCVYCKAEYEMHITCISKPKIGLKRLAEITNKPAP